ncbi:hypothetical protein BJX70DRAFT_374889 [Aspergillus crustosus]
MLTLFCLRGNVVFDNTKAQTKIKRGEKPTVEEMFNITGRRFSTTYNDSHITSFSRTDTMGPCRRNHQ